MRSIVQNTIGRGKLATDLLVLVAISTRIATTRVASTRPTILREQKQADQASVSAPNDAMHVRTSSTA